MKHRVLAAMTLLITGCKSANPHTVDFVPRPTTIAAQAQPASVWTPRTRGVAYQLSLKEGVFGFCDKAAGSQHLDLATGLQSSGSEHCDWDHEEVQSNCDDYVLVSGPTGGGDDNVQVGDHNYVLHGHMHACDQQGKVVLVTSLGGVELIDGSLNKVFVVDPKGGERAVIGSDWIAWQSFDGNKAQLQLETVAQATEHANTLK